MRFVCFAALAATSGMVSSSGSAAAPAANASPKGGLPISSPLASHTYGCLATGNGYLRARIRGTLSLDIDLHNAELDCDGGERPDGSGIRVSFAGPVRSDGRRLRMVFGVGAATEGQPGRALPTNLTVIFEGEQRLFATRGNEHCTVDDLSQERVGDLAGPNRSYRVIARGFCIDPVNALHTSEKILITSFDFAGRVTFEDPPHERPTPSPMTDQAQ